MLESPREEREPEHVTVAREPMPAKAAPHEPRASQQRPLT